MSYETKSVCDVAAERAMLTICDCAIRLEGKNADGRYAFSVMAACSEPHRHLLERLQGLALEGTFRVRVDSFDEAMDRIAP